MQKKWLWILLPIGLVILYRISVQPRVVSQPSVTINIPVLTQIPSVSTKKDLIKNIFVPYWSSSLSNEDLSLHSTYYYFGIRPTKEGTIEKDDGYQKMSLVSKIDENKKKLVLRLLDPTVTEVLLTDKTAQKTLNTELSSVLKNNMFSGVVIDLEVSFTLQPNKEKQITDFVQQMCTDIHAHYKTCYVLIYGDFAYRKRPYDLKKIGEFADRILLMAYDFHKAGGEPGPNFPLSRRSVSEGGPETIDYGYDFKHMVSDAISQVPKDKIEVIFGMYGYDWTLNEQGMPLKSATALSVESLKSKVKSKKLTVYSNEAKEKSITYTDEEGRKHVIWYEDEESAAVKTKYLLEQGIWQTSFWAQSYF